MKRYPILLALLPLAACTGGGSLTRYVNPFIGTGGHGHTFPGAAMPHGMVQLSPDTRMTGWDACSGYHYSDSTIIGFTHTHLSGTGIGDYGDVLLMPTVGMKAVDRGEETAPGTGYRSRFSHDRETARPGYYSVMLDDYGIKAELTATTRAGMHRYTFPASHDAAIVLDLAHTLHEHQNPLLSLNVISDTPAGRITSGWAARLGLPADTVVAVGALDAYMGAVGASVAPGVLVRIIGTSTCDIIVAEHAAVGDRCIEGICGQVDGSVLPGYAGLEAGQSAFGDIYAWFKEVVAWPLRNLMPESPEKQRALDGILTALTAEAEKLPLSQSAPVALDWLNGRRTPYADQNVKGAMGGLTLGTSAPA